MIDYELDQAHSILRVQPESSLDKSDFAELAKVVDPEIEAGGALAGLIIDAPHFPGWDSFGALVTHIRFVRDHHKHVKKIAVVTDSHLGDFAEHLASHFIAAEIRPFRAGQVEQARHWIIGDE
jgi:hypothetical protein